MIHNVYNFKFDNEKKISWLYEGEEKKLLFKYPVEVFLIKERNEILVIADIKETGNNNLTIYKADSSVRIKPKMPSLSKPVLGVYSIFYIKGSENLDTILDSKEFFPYDTGCTFNINTGEFTDFHPSK